MCKVRSQLTGHNVHIPKYFMQQRNLLHKRTLAKLHVRRSNETIRTDASSCELISLGPGSRVGGAERVQQITHNCSLTGTALIIHNARSSRAHVNSIVILHHNAVRGCD